MSNSSKALTENVIAVLQAMPPVGTYHVDDHAGVLFPKLSGTETAVVATRAEVNRAAQMATIRAHQERDILKKARGRAKRLKALEDKITSDADGLFPGLFPNGDIAVAAAELSVGFPKPHDPAVSVVQPLVHMIESLILFRSWAAELPGVAPPPPSNSDPLARNFVEAIGIAYLAHRKKQPPHGRTGPFVNLLAAAWLDVGFPVPRRRREDLSDWLGKKAEALPVLTMKKSYQTR
jgi:hypothetical protein